MNHNRKKVLALVIVLLALVSVSLAACVRPGTPVASGPASTGGGSIGGGSDTVHMTEINFAQLSVTITKGSKLTLIDDAAVPHIIQNGSWVNGTAQNNKETGAPSVQQSFNGNDQASVGPFATAGTFHLYCTIHSNMNLTIVVK